MSYNQEVALFARKIDTEIFETISIGLLSRKRLKIKYHNRERDDITEREISPQRMVYYKDNWLLDTWCHWRRDIRSFSLDAIMEAKLLNKTIKNISEKKLDKHFTSSYGIYSGEPIDIAKLKFSPNRALWVSKEEWHPKQKSYFDKNGAFILEIPYSNETELLMDIIKFGSDVEVLEPESLRDSIIEKLEHNLNIYRTTKS